MKRCCSGNVAVREMLLLGPIRRKDMTTGPRENCPWVYPAIFVLACVLASPASRAAEPQWLKLSSPNFELYTTAGEKRARKAIVYFETIRRFFLNVLQSKQPDGPPIRIIVTTFDTPVSMKDCASPRAFSPPSAR